MARQALSLIAGDALDVWLQQQIRATFSEHTVARALLSVQTGLWPGGEWYAYASSSNNGNSSSSSSSSNSSRPGNDAGSNNDDSSSSSPKAAAIAVAAAAAPTHSSTSASGTPAADNSSSAGSYRTSPGMLPEAYLDYAYDEAEAHEEAEKVGCDLQGCAMHVAGHC
jgi:hypothetical protein